MAAAARTWLGGGGRVAARQDGSDSGGKTAATEAVVVAQTWIGLGGTAVAGQHRVGSNRYGRLVAPATEEAQTWLLFSDGPMDGPIDGRIDGQKPGVAVAAAC